MPVNPKAGESVQFTNLSEGARSYSWNFGDMSIGDEENPAHIYKNPGNYIVDFTATRGLHSDTKTVTIVVIPSNAELFEIGNLLLPGTRLQAKKKT